MTLQERLAQHLGKTPDTARAAFVDKLLRTYESSEVARAEIPTALRTWQWTLERVP